MLAEQVPHEWAVQISMLARNAVNVGAGQLNIAASVQARPSDKYTVQVEINLSLARFDQISHVKGKDLPSLLVKAAPSEWSSHKHL